MISAELMGYFGLETRDFLFILSDNNSITINCSTLAHHIHKTLVCRSFGDYKHMQISFC